MKINLTTHRVYSRIDDHSMYIQKRRQLFQEEDWSGNKKGDPFTMAGRPERVFLHEGMALTLRGERFEELE
jgi:hypothetical protein